VEGRALVALALLLEAELAEVLGRFGHNVSPQLHDNAAGRLAADLHVKEDPRIATDLERLIHRAAHAIHLLLHPGVKRLPCAMLLLHRSARFEIRNLVLPPFLRRRLVRSAPQSEDLRAVVGEHAGVWSRHVRAHPLQP